MCVCVCIYIFLINNIFSLHWSEFKVKINELIVMKNVTLHLNGLKKEKDFTWNKI